MSRHAVAAFGAFAVLACGNSNPTNTDANAGDARGAQCDVLLQQGCADGEKCTWILDALTPEVLGHVGCAPNSGAVTDGATCMYGPAGATGFDDCTRGHLCFTPPGAPEGPGVCKEICDQQGGAPVCDTDHACTKYPGLLGPTNGEAGGVCDIKCDPFADNLFGKTSKPGSTCSAGAGCYPKFSNTPPLRSVATCALVGNPTAYAGSPCNSTNGCADDDGPFINGCAEGFVPFISDDVTGKSTFECKSLCKLADCSSEGCGTNAANHAGAAPHRCNATDSSGTFDTTSTDAGGEPDGDSCYAIWRFEIDTASNRIVSSPFSDTLGVCIDHQAFHYDANHDGTTSMTEVWPACSSLPIIGTDSTHPGARDFGCVTATTSGLMTTMPPAKPALQIERPRLPSRFQLRR